MGNHLTTIMDKDPELKQLAFKNGMTDKQLKAVENLSEYFKINDARNKAQLKLAEAAANHTELPQEEKARYPDNVLVVVTKKRGKRQFTFDNANELAEVLSLLKKAM